MKKQIEVKLFGLNEFGVNELNEFYKLNLELKGSKPFTSEEFDEYPKHKRFKNANLFTFNGLDNYICDIDCTQVRTDGLPGYGPRFSLQVKHFKHEIYKVEVVETFKKITL